MSNISNKLICCLSISLFALLIPSKASSYKVNITTSGYEVKWVSRNCTYNINVSNGPTGSTLAIQNAMQTWTEVKTSQFQFVDGGETNVSAFGVLDGINLIDFGNIDDLGAVAVNNFWIYYPGRMAESDIRLNTNYSWSTNGSSIDYDVQDILTHELGHSLSLGDLYEHTDSEKTMYGYGTQGETKKRTLDPDDIAGISYLYPAPSLIGVFRNGEWYLDDGDVAWAWGTTDRYIIFGGLPDDLPVTGDWGGTGSTKIGIFRNGAWYLDMNGNGLWDETVRYFGGASDIPVVGDWNGTGTAKIGVFRNGAWYLDMNGNGLWDETVVYFGTAGDIPVVGDWNGTGTAKIGVFRNGAWYLDMNGNGLWDETVAYFGTAGDVPVVGDWNGTGTAKIGVFRNGAWYLDMNGNGLWDETVAYFGTAGDIPVMGRW